MCAFAVKYQNTAVLPVNVEGEIRFSLKLLAVMERGLGSTLMRDKEMDGWRNA